MCGCGQTLNSVDRFNKERRYVLGHNSVRRVKTILCECQCGGLLKNRNDIGFVVEYIKGHEPSNRQTRINRKVLRNRIVIKPTEIAKGAEILSGTRGSGNWLWRR
jgi:hypothetical protein